MTRHVLGGFLLLSPSWSLAHRLSDPLAPAKAKPMCISMAAVPCDSSMCTIRSMLLLPDSASDSPSPPSLCPG
jgi:TRAP-type C4-dicarboxylate transport system permease small subunit